MSSTDPLRETLSTESLVRINQVCEKFEAAWKRGERPKIEDYLEGAEGNERTWLLRELLGLEIDYRRGNGEEPSIREYALRFPPESMMLLVALSR